MSAASMLRNPRVQLWGRRIAITLGALLLLAGVVALVAPPLVRDVLQKGLADYLQRSVSVGVVRINPLRLSATVRDLRIDGRKGEPPLLELGEVEINVDAGHSILHRAAVVRELRIERPRIYIARETDNRYSISDILERIAAQPKKADKGETRFALYNLEVVGGDLRFNDKPLGREHHIERVSLGLPFISNIPADVDVHATPHLFAVVNGTALDLGGKARPFLRDRRDAELAIKLAPIELAQFLGYLPKKPGVKFSSGKLAADLRLAFSQPLGKPPEVKLTGQVSAVDWTLDDGDDSDIAHFDLLKVELADVQPLARRVHVRSVELVQPEVAVEFDREHQIKALRAAKRELAAYAPPAAAAGATPEAAPAKPADAWQWQVDRIGVRNGLVNVSDTTVEPAMKLALSAIEFDLKGLSAALDKPATVKLSVKGDGDGVIQFDGSAALQPLLVQGTLDFAGIKPARQASYVTRTLPALVLDDAVIGGHVPFVLRGGEAGVGVVLTDAQLKVDQLALRLQGEKAPFFKADSFSLNGLTLDLPKRSIKLAAVQFSKPEAALRRGKNGQFDLARLAGKPAPESSKSKPAAAGSAWSYAVEKLAIDGATVRYEDDSRRNPLRMVLAPLGLEVSGIDSRPNQFAELALTTGWNQKGKLSVAGKVSPQPLRVDLKINGRGLDVVPVIAQATADYEVSVTRAKLSAQGQLALDMSKADAPAGSYKGQVSVADFASIDLINDADFVRWSLLGLNKVDFRLSPLSVGVGEIVLKDLQTKLILSKDGALNLREVTQRRHAADDDGATAIAASTAKPLAPAAKAGPAPVKAPAAPLPPIRIDRVVLSGASINYSDRFVKPNFDARLSGVTGRLENLGTDPARVATLDLRGAVDGIAPLEVVGQLAPFRNDRFLDVKASVKGYELTALSSYASRYVGYGIEKGRLSMDLRYKIVDRQLSADNHVFLDQLTFGDKVESPDATSLPVRFAVNLLKNSRGEIDINLPVGGTLDDPEFSAGGIIWKMILNFFGKVVSAPFSFLIGGSEAEGELSSLAFTPGTARLDADANKRLESVAKVLLDRPVLKLELTGRADPLVDAEGLKRERFQRKVRSLKLQDMAKAGESGGSIDEVRVSAEEYPALLKRVYADEKIPNKPRNLVGFQKDIAVPEMERLLMGNAAIGESDVHALAQERANVVKRWLVESGKVPAESIFVLAPKLGPDAADKAGGKAAATISRVDFSLR